VRDAAERAKVPPDAVILALLTAGDAITEEIIEHLGRGAHLILERDAAGRLVTAYDFEAVCGSASSVKYRVAGLRSDDPLVRRLRIYATLPLPDLAGGVLGSEDEILARLRRHHLGGLCVDGDWHVSRLMLARIRALPRDGQR
jgi:hypothetical protein